LESLMADAALSGAGGRLTKGVFSTKGGM